MRTWRFTIGIIASIYGRNRRVLLFGSRSRGRAAATDAACGTQQHPACSAAGLKIGHAAPGIWHAARPSPRIAGVSLRKATAREAEMHQTQVIEIPGI